MPSAAIGLCFLLVFALSQGVRDALFGNVFQSISFLVVAALTFGLSTLCFLSVTLLRRPEDLRTLVLYPVAFAALNVTTAAAWLSFFFALKHLEPAVVATLYNGAGPLAVLVVGALGWARAGSRPSVGEWLCYAGLAVVLTALIIVVLADRSGLGATDGRTQGHALLAAAIGGVMIAISHIIARWFNDHGVGSDAVMGTRFLLAFAVAVAIESAAAMTTARPSPGALSLLVLAALGLVVIPSFMLQLGIARASPLAVNIMRALGPVSVFAVQQFDGRLRFSGATLVCIIGYGVLAVAASVLRAWGELGMRPDDGPPRLEELSFRSSSGRR